MSHKDCIGQVIKVKDMIAYGDSYRTAGVNIGMVFEFTPKQIKTSIGSLNPAYCVVITDQYKAHDLKAYEDLLVKHKESIVESSVVVKKPPKMEYKISLHFIGKNSAGGDKDYRDFFIEVRVFADGVEQGTTSSPSPRASIKSDIHEFSFGVTRHYEKTGENGWYGEKMVRSGKLEIGTIRYADRKDYLLAGTSVKQVFGSVPAETTRFHFKGGIEALDMLARGGVIIETRTKHSGHKNALAEILGV